MKRTISKEDLIKDATEIIKKENGRVTQVLMRDALNALIESFQNHLAQGDAIRLQDIGIFSTIKRAERKYCNPITNEMGIIPAHTSPKFKPSKALKDLVASLNV